MKERVKQFNEIVKKGDVVVCDYDKMRCVLYDSKEHISIDFSDVGVVIRDALQGEDVWIICDNKINK